MCPRLRKIYFDASIYQARNTFKGIGKHHHEVKNILEICIELHCKDLSFLRYQGFKFSILMILNLDLFLIQMVKDLASEFVFTER